MPSKKIIIFSSVAIITFLAAFSVYAKTINFGQSADIIYISGKVGIGTTNPGAKLQLNPLSGVEGIRIELPSASPWSPIAIVDSNGADVFRVSQNGDLTITGDLIGVSVGGWTRDDTNGYLYTTNSGDNVGIGDDTPDYSLDVRDNGTDAIVNIEDVSNMLPVEVRFTRAVNDLGTEDWSIGMSNIADKKFRIRRSGTTDDMVIDTSGNVYVPSGIRIGADSANNEIDDDSQGLASTALYIGNQRITTEDIDTDTYITTQTCSTDYALQSVGKTSKTCINKVDYADQAYTGDSATAFFSEGSILTTYTDAKCTSSACNDAVYSEATIQSVCTLCIGDAQIVQNSIDGSEIADDALDFVDFQDTLDLDASTQINVGTGENFYIDLDGTADFIIRDVTTNMAVFYDNGDVQLGNNNELYVDTSAGNVGIGITNPGYDLEVEGTIYADVYEGEGCDIAEYYESAQDSGKLEPGDIVVLDEDREMKIKKSDKAYSSLVIGVISTKPNMVMGAIKGTEDHPPVALLGRVPTKVTTENGPIKIGDYIVSSSKPGYGMRCEDFSKCQGAIIGKALQKLESGEGVIEVLIDKM